MAVEKAKNQPEAIKFSARIPRELYDALCAKRDESGLSINDLLVAGAAKVLGVKFSGAPKGIPGRKPKRNA